MNVSKTFLLAYNYPDTVVENTIRHFIDMKITENACSKQWVSDEQDAPFRIVLPFKDQKSVNALKKTPTQWPQSKDWCWCPACLHKSEDQRKNQTKGTLTSNNLHYCETTKRCLLFQVWSDCLMQTKSAPWVNTYINVWRNTSNKHSSAT